MAQDLRQVGWAELAGSAGAVRERGETNTGLLVDRAIRHLHLLLSQIMRESNEGSLLLSVEPKLPSIRWRPKGVTARRTAACASFVPSANKASTLKQIGVCPGAVLR